MVRLLRFMSNYEQLASLVEEERVSMVNMVAVPRSISTALGRALNESDTRSIFINEPFNRNNQSLEVATKHILGVVLPELDDNDSKLTVITKNMATYLGEKEFYHLDKIATGNVWSVRDPLIQIGSLAIRMANDSLVENGADTITTDEIWARIDRVTDLLANSDTSTNFSRTGWKSISQHFLAQTAPSVVIDGSDLSAQPKRVLKVASELLGLDYSDRMATGWRANYVNINIGTSRFDTESNAWTGHAATSDGITMTNRMPMDLETLPQALWEHVVQIAIPAYEIMRGHLMNSY